MSKIAIDVVFIPPGGVMNDSIEMNKKLNENLNHEVQLNKDSCVPHISLAIGCVDDKDLNDVEEILRKITKEFLPINLRILRLKSGVNFSSFEIEKSERLQELHEKIMEKLKPYTSFEATSDMFCTPPEINKLTLGWMKNFSETSTLENFSPHITLGYGKVGGEYGPKDFTSSRLAVYQLGNYFTCRKLLFSFGD